MFKIDFTDNADVCLLSIELVELVVYVHGVSSSGPFVSLPLPLGLSACGFASHQLCDR